MLNGRPRAHGPRYARARGRLACRFSNPTSQKAARGARSPKGGATRVGPRAAAPSRCAPRRRRDASGAERRLASKEWRGAAIAGGLIAVVGRACCQPRAVRSCHVRFAAAGFARSPPVTGRRAGLSRRAPTRSKGRRYPPDPPRTEEIIAVMRCCGDGLHGDRARGLIVMLWRAGLRIQEALDLTELDLDPRRGSVLVRRGKGGRRREVGMDDWGFEQLEPWLRARQTMPVGPLFCVINGRTRGRAWHASAARAALRRRAVRAGVRRRFAPHQCGTCTRSSCCARACR